MSLRDNLARVEDAIAAACARRGRASGSVRLLAATKTVAPERIREAHALGVRLFGENRVQEREEKRAAVAGLAGAEWHLLGGLQSNKAARALALFDCIETVDSLALAQRLSRLAAHRAPVLLEVNLGREPQKRGALPEQVPALAAAVRELPQLELRGLMAVPPHAAEAEAARPHFAALAELAARLGLAELSMGMSQDFAVAVEEGATLVRLGSALFGPRPALG